MERDLITHSTDGIEALVASHVEIRRTLDELTELARAGDRNLEQAQNLREEVGIQFLAHEEFEDALLLPMLGSAGDSECLATATATLKAHGHLHGLRTAVLEALDQYIGGTATAPTFAETVDAFVQGMRMHLAAEEKHLYPLARQVLTEDDRRELARQFKKLLEI